MANERIGFIGLGNMGWHMASNLVRAGHTVYVHDSQPQTSQRFSQQVGGHAVTTLTQLAEASDLVITMLPNGKVVRDVTLGSGTGGDRLLDHLKAGAVLIDMSSSDPSDSQQLQAALSEAGIVLLDAPVSGAVPRAEAGTLTIMLGAPHDYSLDKVKAVLGAMGNKVVETGPVGSGHAMKALNNYVAAIGLSAASEAIKIGALFGLEAKTMVDIMSTSTGKNFAIEHIFPAHILEAQFNTGFKLSLLEKDVGIARHMAESRQAAAPFIELTSREWSRARQQLGEVADNSEYFNYAQGV